MNMYIFFFSFYDFICCSKFPADKTSLCHYGKIKGMDIIHIHYTYTIPPGQDTTQCTYTQSSQSACKLCNRVDVIYPQII